MDSYLALFLALIVVVGLAMALAAYNNRAEEPAPKQERQQKKKKADKKKAKDVVPDEKDKKKKKKKAQPPVTFTWDGTVENDDESMIELLRGTSEHLAKEAKDEIKKKVRAVAATVGQTVEKTTKGKGSKKNNEDEEEDKFEFVPMKRKKVDDKAKSKKKADKASKEVKEAAPVVEGEVAAIPAEASSATNDKENKKGNKTKSFYKRGVFQSLRDAANAEYKAKQQEEEEKANARSAGRKKEGAAEEPTEAKDDRKDKPAKPKKANNAEGANAEVNADQAVGPRQPQKPRREPREPREPKEPREAPPPPPRPIGGSFETASLDDMLSAISSHYGPKPKQNFAKLPPTVLARLLKMLTVRDVITLSKVNHFLSKQSRDDKLWKSLCEKDFAMKFPKNMNSKKKFRIVYRDEYLKSKGKAPAK